MKNNYVKAALIGAMAAGVAMTSCNEEDNNLPLDTIATANVRSVMYDAVPDCAEETLHQHNGVYYTGHYNNDGHTHHSGLEADEACSVVACTETGTHQHNGQNYAGHHGDDGHSHHGNGHHF